MNVVIDTNVLVSSFWGGNPRKIMLLWTEGRITLCMTQEIVEEYIEVLARMGLDGEPELFQILELIKSGKNIEYSIGKRTQTFIKDDPDDDKFINCAIEHDCRIIVSGDKHLLGAKRILDIEILNPKFFLEKFNSLQR